MKKVLSLILLICTILNIGMSAQAVKYGEELQNSPQKTYKEQFNDVSKDHWAFSYIGEMAERGVINGYPDGNFYPEAQVTRAEFAKIMTTAAGFTVLRPILQLFADVKTESWYAPYVHAAKEYLSAYAQNGKSYYRPDAPALREDIAVALVKLKGYSTLGTDGMTLQRMFSDYYSISADAQIYVAAAIENGLVSGYNDGTFRGQSSISRAEAATLLWRVFQYGDENKVYENVTKAPETIDEIIYAETEIEEVKKPFIMKKLASAKIKSLSHATFDGKQSIYYIDTEKKEVYKVDVESGEKTKIFEVEELSYKTGTGENITTYTDFCPLQVFYDETNQNLLLNGYYQKVNKPGEMPGQVYKRFIYRLNDGEVEVYCQPYVEAWQDNYRDYMIQAFLNDDFFLFSESFGSTYKVKIETGEIKVIRLEVANKGEYAYTAVLKNKTDIYGIKYGIDRYDFGEDEAYTIFNDGLYIDKDGFGIYKEYYYIWNEDEIYKISVKTRMAEQLGISTKGDKVEFEDMGNMNQIDGKFFVIDENTFVFYDHEMQAFRILARQ